jgi:hypothetical protein
MTKQTTNLNLNKPDMADQIALTISQLGSNFDIIDASITNNTTALADSTSQLTQLAYNVKVKGGAKGDGTATNEDVAINNALVNNNIVYVPDGTYKISNTIIVPTNKKLILGKRTNIIPVSNIDVFQLNPSCYVEGGYVDVSTIAAYSKSIITISSGTIDNIRVYGLQASNNINTPTGIGINLDCTVATNKISMFSQFKDISIVGFQYGIYSNSTQTATNFANANYFDGVVSFCLSAIYNVNSDGNYYNITGQSPLTANNEPSIYIKGNNNIITGIIFDIGLTGHSAIYCEVDGVRNTIYTDINRKFVNDHKDGSNYFVRRPADMVLPPSRGQSIGGFLGQQDNFLADADKRFTVTETFTNTADWSDISYQFKTNATTLAETETIYHFNNAVSLTDNVQIDIDLLTAYYIRGFGITQKSNAYCKQVILSAFSTSDNVWHSKTFNPTGSGIVYLSVEDVFGFNIASTITKLRIQLFQPITANISINNIFAGSGNGGNAYLPARGGKLYGDIDLNKNLLKNAVLDKAATASRPASPVKGQMFYDTTLNKPIWYNGTAWTDATGTTV